MKLIDKDALVAEIEKGIKLLFENNDRLYDKYGNYFYKNAENDYRFYHKLDEDNWDEDRLTLTDVIEYLFRPNLFEMKEVDLDEETLHSELRKIYASVYDSKDIESAKHFFELGMQVSNKAQKGE